MSSGVSIRRGGAADAALLAEIGRRTFEQAFGSQNDPEQLARYLGEAFSEARLRDELAALGSSFFLAEDGDRARGYARILAGPAPEGVPAERPLELVRIYVDAAAQGLGVGAALMRACLEAGSAGGHDRVWLGVWERNPRAIAFYERWGFETVGRKTFVIGDDVQRDLVMARPLDPPPAG